MRAFADACNAWIEKVSGNASIPIANVVVQQPIATEVDVSRAKKTLTRQLLIYWESHKKHLLQSPVLPPAMLRHY